MRNNIMKFFISLPVILFLTSNGYSWDKEKTEEMIKKGEALMTELDNDPSLKEFIPYDIYSEAIINIRNSRTHVENKEYNLAYFYATISTLKLETASYFAKAKKYRYQKILIERDLCKRPGTKQIIESKIDDNNYKYITYANLFRKDNVYKTELLDKDIFDKKSFLISTKGRNILDKVIEVLKRYPGSSIKVIGHTSFNDYKKISGRKSLALKNYLVSSGIDAKKVEMISAGNDVLMNTPVGFRRIDRIELILNGIE